MSVIFVTVARLSLEDCGIVHTKFGALVSFAMMTHSDQEGLREGKGLFGPIGSQSILEGSQGRYSGRS